MWSIATNPATLFVLAFITLFWARSLAHFVLESWGTPSMSVKDDNFEKHEDVSVKDVLRVKALLHQSSTAELPLEIIDMIIDFAEYWPHTSIMTRNRTAAGHHDSENVFLCRSLPLGCLSPDSTGNSERLLSPDSNFPIYLPQPAPPRQEDADFSAKQLAIFDYWKKASLPRGEHPCRKIIFTMKSHDQGWGGSIDHRGTYQGSFTWFDAGLEHFEQYQPEVGLPLAGEMHIEELNGWKSTGMNYSIRTSIPSSSSIEGSESGYKFDHPFLSDETRIQCNVTAKSETTEHVVTWSYDDAVDPDSEEGKALSAIGRGTASATGDFVRALKVGDIITVWARARFPGWRNVIEEVKIDVYWAV